MVIDSEVSVKTIRLVFLRSEKISSSYGLFSTFGGTAGGGDEPAVDEPINIFSVASGHLYERFLRIMMLSVIKHTKSPVKFWFLKNYLSPSFKVRDEIGSHCAVEHKNDVLIPTC